MPDIFDTFIRQNLDAFATPLTVNDNFELRALVDQGWRVCYAEWFGKDFVDILAPHHIEAIEWHWESRTAFLEDRKPDHLAYFPIWSRGHAKCLDENTDVLMADGTRKSIKQIQRGEWVQSWDESTGKMVLQPVLDQWCAGKKQCVKLTTRTGWELIGTPDHRVRTFDGWKAIGELLPTDRIASPRRTIASRTPWQTSPEEIRLLTYFLAEGNTTTSGSGIGCKAIITNADHVIVQDAIQCAESLGFTGKKAAGLYNTGFQNGVVEWLRQNQVAGKKATEKRLPKWMFKLSREQIAHTIAAWLDTDGFVGEQCVGITLANELLIQDLRYLLLQYGVITKQYFRANDFAGAWTLSIDQTAFDLMRELPFILKGDYWQKIDKTWRYSLVDTYPQSVTFNLPKGMNRRLRRTIGWKPSYINPRVTRNKIQRALEVESVPLWEWLENADVFWDEIKSIEDVGERLTYDLEVKNTHNFIAEGLVTHNSTLAEHFVVVDGLLSYAYNKPGYALYVARSKDKVEEHIKNIETLLSTEAIRKWCPKLSNPKRSTTTNQQSKWTSTFLKSEANYSIQGGSLDSGLAGSRVEETRPSYITLDDIDGREDSHTIADTRLKQLTTEILPMRQGNTLVFFAQNLISRFSTMYKIHKGQVRVLTNRKPSAPVPAVIDLVTREETVDGIVKDIYVSGEITWKVWDIQRVQDEIDTEGLESFERECNHKVDESQKGRIFSNYDDNVHVISESEFNHTFGKDSWLTWRKKPGNDWAKTKTDYHANVANWLCISDAMCKLPNVTILRHALSFPEDSAAEDIAERLLSCLSDHAYIDKDGNKVSWEQLRKDVLANIGADQHTTTVKEKIDYERGSLSRVIPRYSQPLLQRCNVQQGEMSHEMSTVRKIYRNIYALGFKGINPHKYGGVELIQRDLRVDYNRPHAIRPNTMGYTRWYMVAPDDIKRPYEIDGVTVYYPTPFPSDLKTDKLVDTDLWRFQMKNYRNRPPIVTASGEEIDNPAKMYDDGPNCFVAGTLITTNQGNIPIERIQAGQKVLTRKGWQDVEYASPTGTRLIYEAELNDGTILRGTREHPIWVQNKGWTPLGDLKIGNLLQMCYDNPLWQTILPNLNQNESFLTASLITDTPTQSNVRTEFISPPTSLIKKKAITTCTLTSGKPPTVTYRKGFIFTTLMKTRLTMIFPTLSALVYPSIFLTIPKNENLQINGEKNWIMPEQFMQKWVGRNTGQKRGVRNSQTMPSNIFSTVQYLPVFANSAEKNFSQHVLRQNIAVNNAVTIRGEELKTTNLFARTVEEILLHATLAADGVMNVLIKQIPPTSKNNVIRKIVEDVMRFLSLKMPDSMRVRPNALKSIKVRNVEKVYNLQVKNCPEYYANGILVHNCLMMQYVGARLQGSSLTTEQQVDLLVPQETKMAVATASTGTEKLSANLIYEFEHEIAKMTLEPEGDEYEWD